jgi:tetratricopeptide (TPR) repeat protein
MTAAPVKRTTQRDLARGMSDWEAKHLLAAEAIHKAGNFLAAAKKYEKILKRNPRCWPAVFNAAVLAHTICEHTWAIENFRRCVKVLPGFAEAWYNLGTMQQCVGQYAEAAHALEQAVALDPALVGAGINLGNAYLGLGRRDDAFAAYQRALAHKPDSAEAMYNLAHYYLLTGDWVQGWRCYEARWHLAGFQELNQITVDGNRTDIPVPWAEGVPIAGKTLVVAEEQGYGDLFMTLRYAPMLRDLGGSTIWAVRPECRRLVEATVAPDRVVSIRDAVPGADYIVSCMTLHHRLGITPETVPGAEGYLMRGAA